jgi:hypothetical protein
MLKPYNKQAVAAVINALNLSGSPAKKSPKTPGWKPKKTTIDFKKLKKESSFWQPTQWPAWWEEGAKELEKTTPGKLVTAPVRLTEAALTSTTKTVAEVPGIVKMAKRTIPIVAIAAVLVGGGYLLYRYKSEKKRSLVQH